MQKRYEGWLPPSKPSPWPGAVLCLEASVRWNSLPSETRRQYIRLERWHATLCVRQGGEYTIARSAVGNDAESFWRTLQTASLRCNNLWVLCSRTREAAAALGLWERMESGHVCIDGSDWRTKGLRIHAMPTMRQSDRRDMGSESASMGNAELPIMPHSVDASQRPTARGNHAARNRTGGICVLQDPPIILELRIDGGGSKITWVDEANYGIDVARNGADNGNTTSALAAWFISAASTLHTLGKCGWQHTAGSQAMHLFRSVYHATPILSHTERHATALESDGLFGGRCECFQLGRVEGPVHMYDIRSMYPYLCATLEAPVALTYVHQSPTVSQVVDAIGTYGFAIARVDIETTEPDYPYRLSPEEQINVRGRTVAARTIYGSDPAIIFPTGRYTSCLVGEELFHALQAGRVHRVRCAAFYKTNAALARYATELYKIRCSTSVLLSPELQQWIKRLMVSLPGKFAQRSSRWIDVPGAELPSEWGEYWRREGNGEFTRWRTIGGHVQREERGGFSWGAVPAIATAICAAGRSRLLGVVNAAGRDNVYYIDTDALVCNDQGRESLTQHDWIQPGEWGYLQHVCTADSAEIYGVKRYRIGGRIRSSGIVPKAGCDIQANRSDTQQPTAQQSIRHQERPADWRQPITSVYGPGRYEQLREPGGRVRPVELDRWDND